jgi:CO/xanthine dehydrogenase FAD-binding subunit
MRPFEYVRADDVAAAVALVSADPQAEYLAGGTTELDLVLKDGGARARAARRHHPAAAAGDHPR